MSDTREGPPAAGAVPPRRKSIVLSGVLSFFLGPYGLLYAGSLREAVPLAIAWTLVLAILPHFVLFYVAGLLCPLSGVAGVLYAWSYNRGGERLPLLLPDRSTVNKRLKPR